MILKFLSKYILEVIPSIVATVVGAYIVTHYINAKPDADKPKAAVSAPANPESAQPQKADETTDKASPADSKAKAAEKSSSDNAASDKSVTSAAPAERGDNSAELRRRQASGRDKVPAKSTPAATSAPAVEAAAPVTDDKRDANEIVRAAVERLREADPAKSAEPRTQDSRAAEPPRAPERRVNVTYSPVPSAPTPPVQALPPAVNVEPPPVIEAVPANAASEVRSDNPSRPVPPADIPSRPLDLHGNSSGRTSVADEVVSAAKSVFNVVVPR